MHPLLDTATVGNTDNAARARPAAPARPYVLVMAAATGFAIANLYYNQPILGLIGLDLRAGRTVSLIPTVTQLGYALGILFLVPLGDQLDRRRLVLLQCCGLIVALALAAAAPSIVWLIAASTLVGVFASIAQQIVPFAAELAEPASQGRTVGAVMSGLLVGILAARILSGLVGQAFGWRAVFWMAAGLATLMTGILAARLPHSCPATWQPYPRLLASLWHLTLREPELRRAALTQGLLFAGFWRSAAWPLYDVSWPRASSLLWSTCGETADIMHRLVSNSVVSQSRRDDLCQARLGPPRRRRRRTHTGRRDCVDAPVEHDASTLAAQCAAVRGIDHPAEGGGEQLHLA